MLHTAGIYLTQGDKVSLFYGEDNPAAVNCSDNDDDDHDNDLLVHGKTQRRITSLFSRGGDTSGMSNSTYFSLLSTVRPSRRVSEPRPAKTRLLSPDSHRRCRTSFFRQVSADSLDTTQENEFNDTDTSFETVRSGRSVLRWPVGPFFSQKKHRLAVSPSCIHRSDNTLNAIDKQNQPVIDILRIRPLLLAQQMTLIELKHFRVIKPEEFLSFKWNCREKTKYAPYISASTRWFNQIIFWLHQEILSVTSVSKRTEVISHFIRTAKKLIDLNNICSAKAVVTALQVECVHRLKATWAGVSSKDRATFAKLADLFVEDNNFQRLRTCHENAQLPCIPYLGLYLNDLTYIHLACPATITQGEGVFTNQVRLDRINNIIRILAHFQTSTYPFTRNESVASYLESHTYLEELQRFIEDSNYKASLRIEPPPSSTTEAISVAPSNRFQKTHHQSFSTASSTHTVSSASSSPNSLNIQAQVLPSSPIFRKHGFYSVTKNPAAVFLKSHKRLGSWTCAFNAETPSTPMLSPASIAYCKSKHTVQSGDGMMTTPLTPSKLHFSTTSNDGSRSDSLSHALGEDIEHITFTIGNDEDKQKEIPLHLLRLDSNSLSFKHLHNAEENGEEKITASSPGGIFHLPEASYHRSKSSQPVILSSLASTALNLLKQSFQVLAEGPVLSCQTDSKDSAFLANTCVMCESDIAFPSKTDSLEESEEEILSISSLSSTSTTTPPFDSQSSISNRVRPLCQNRRPLSAVHFSRKISNISSKASSLILSLVHRRRRPHSRKKLHWAVLLAAPSSSSTYSFSLALVLFRPRSSLRSHISSPRFSSKCYQVYSPIEVLPASRPTELCVSCQVEGGEDTFIELSSVVPRQKQVSTTSLLRRISNISLGSRRRTLSSTSVASSPSFGFLHSLVMNSPLAPQLLAAFPSLSSGLAGR